MSIWDKSGFHGKFTKQQMIIMESNSISSKESETKSNQKDKDTKVERISVQSIQESLREKGWKVFNILVKSEVNSLEFNQEYKSVNIEHFPPLPIEEGSYEFVEEKDSRIVYSGNYGLMHEGLCEGEDKLTYNNHRLIVTFEKLD